MAEDYEEGEAFDDEFFDIEKSKIKENRYYFHNNKMVSWIDDKKSNIDINKEEFLQKEKT